MTAADFDVSDAPVYHAEAETTSISSILSLILGVLGCCGGVTAIPGLVLAVIGIVSVSRSKGRVGGMGFAVAGLILSVLNIALWGAALLSAVQGANWVRDAADTQAQMLSLLEQGDYDGARAMMVAPLETVSDEEFAAFVAAYTAELGSVVSAPATFGEMLEAYGPVIEGFEPFSGRQNFIPLTVMFDNGYALVVAEMDPDALSASGGALHPKRFYVVLPDGTVLSLPLDTTVSGLPGQGEAPASGDGTFVDGVVDGFKAAAESAEEEAAGDAEGAVNEAVDAVDDGDVDPEGDAGGGSDGGSGDEVGVGEEGSDGRP